MRFLMVSSLSSPTLYMVASVPTNTSLARYCLRECCSGRNMYSSLAMAFLKYSPQTATHTWAGKNGVNVLEAFLLEGLVNGTPVTINENLRQLTFALAWEHVGLLAGALTLVKYASKVASSVFVFSINTWVCALKFVSHLELKSLWDVTIAHFEDLEFKNMLSCYAKPHSNHKSHRRQIKRNLIGAISSAS